MTFERTRQPPATVGKSDSISGQAFHKILVSALGLKEQKFVPNRFLQCECVATSGIYTSCFQLLSKISSENPIPCKHSDYQSWVEFIWRKLRISKTRKKP